MKIKVWPLDRTYIYGVSWKITYLMNGHIYFGFGDNFAITLDITLGMYYVAI